MLFLKVTAFMLFRLFSARVDVKLCLATSLRKLRGLGVQFCKFQHVRRDGNKLAHSLAKRAVLSVDTDVWVEELPSKLDAIFQSDLP